MRRPHTAQHEPHQFGTRAQVGGEHAHHQAGAGACSQFVAQASKLRGSLGKRPVTDVIQGEEALPQSQYGSRFTRGADIGRSASRQVGSGSHITLLHSASDRRQQSFRTGAGTFGRPPDQA